MTIDDPGWGGFIEDGAPETSVQADAEATSNVPPHGPPATEQRAAEQPPIGWQPPWPSTPPSVGPAKRRLAPMIALIAAVLVIVGGGAGAAIALTGSKSSPTTTQPSTTQSSTTQPSTTQSSTTQSSTTKPSTSTSTSATAGGTGSAEPPLLSVIPTALSGTCKQASAADLASVAGAIEEIACNSASVSGSSADLIGYVRFRSTAALDGFFSHLLSLNQLSTSQGDCSSVTLSASTTAGEYCEGTYTDNLGNTGSELIFVGSDFNAGGPSGSAAAGCSTAFPNSNGVTVLVWTSPSDNSGGIGVDCTSSLTQFVNGMQSNLVAGNYGLND